MSSFIFFLLSIFNEHFYTITKVWNLNKSLLKSHFHPKYIEILFFFNDIDCRSIMFLRWSGPRFCAARPEVPIPNSKKKKVIMNMNRIHGKADWFFLNDFKWDFIIWAIYFLGKKHQKKSRSCIFHLNAKSSRHESAVMRRIVGSFIIIKTTTRISSRGKNPANELFLRTVTNNWTPNPK